MESSRRDRLNDVAEHKSILKNNLNTTPFEVACDVIEFVELGKIYGFYDVTSNFERGSTYLGYFSR